jgi:hypothetical protein
MIFAQRSQAGAGAGLGLRRGGISKVGEMKPKMFFAMVVQRIAGRYAVKVLARLRCVCVVAGILCIVVSQAGGIVVLTGRMRLHDGLTALSIPMEAPACPVPCPCPTPR